MLNAALSYSIQGSIANSIGLFTMTRTSATQYVSYYNITVSSTFSKTTTGRPTKELFIGAYNNNGTIINGRRGKVAFFYAGRHLTLAKTTALSNAISAYLNSPAIQNLIP